MKKVTVDGGKTPVVLVPRQQLKRKVPLARMRVPAVSQQTTAAEVIPVPPASRDWRGKTALPVLGNDREGDCFYAAMCHLVQVWMGARGNPIDFDARSVLHRYEQLSGGDNGLDWETIRPEFSGGIIGPRGPYRALGFLGVDPADALAQKTAIELFGGQLLTLGIPDEWLRNHAYSGAVWDAGPRVVADQSNGHAVVNCKYDAGGVYVETWGFQKPILLTWAGLQVCDAEISAVLGADWIGSNGPLPNKYTPAQVLTWWVMLGGSPLLQVALEHLRASRPESITPSQWEVLLQALMALLEAFLQHK